MRRVLFAFGLLLLLLTPLAAARIRSGHYGDETGVQVDEPGVVHFDCGLYGPYLSPRVDFSYLGGPDTIPDSGFYSYGFIIPIACYVVGLNVHQDIPA